MPPVLNSPEEVFGQLLQDFLCRPDRQQFRDLFDTCYIRCRNYLRMLRARGWLLPVDARTDKDPIDDLVFDVLGHLFSKKRDKPFYKIFEYFESKGVIDFRNSDPEMLSSHFMILLRSFARQEMHRLKWDIDPGKSNIKRRFQDILKGDNYISVTGGLGTGESVSRIDYQKDMRTDANAVTKEIMERIVTQSLLSTTNDTALCRDFFRRLNDMQENQNFAPFRALVDVLVAVRISYAEEGMVFPSEPLSPAVELASKELNKAIERSLDRVRKTDIQKFVSNGRVTKDKGRCMLEACRNYLHDSFNGNGTDSVPHYFLEQLPTIPQEVYLSEFKYPFETVIDKAQCYLREEIEDNSILGTFRDY